MVPFFFLSILGSLLNNAHAINGGNRVPWTENSFRQRTVQVIDGNGYCSGTVVGENWVLTAAHCVKRAPVKISFDKFDITEDPTIEPVIEIVTNPDYPKNKSADLALLRIEKRIPFGYKPATLAKKNLMSGEAVNAAGYGKRNTGSLYYVELKLLEPFTKSQMRWRQSSSEGICDGDSGGSILVPETFELLAVIQRSPADCDGHASGGSVPYFYDWIVNTID